MDDLNSITAEDMTKIDINKVMRPTDLSQDALDLIYSDAFHLYENGKYAEAQKFFRLLTMLNSNDRRHWMGLGATFQQLKEYHRAIECYSVAALQNYEDPYVHFHAAECYLAENNSEKGLQALDSAIDAAQNSPDHHSLLAQLKLMQASWSGQYTEEASKGAVS